MLGRAGRSRVAEVRACAVFVALLDAYPPSMTLAEGLDDWTDWDRAAFVLGQTLGVFERVDFLEAKHVFWTDNALGEGLHDALLALVRGGVLDRRDEPDEQFRWRCTVAPDDR